MTPTDFSSVHSMQPGDRVKLVGTRWRGTIPKKEPFYGDIVSVSYVDTTHGEAIFEWTDQFTGLVSIWSIDDGEWCAIIMPKYTSKDIIEERSVLIASDPALWNSLAEIALIQKEKEIVESNIRHTYRFWPHNKRVAHEVDRQRQKIIFYWASVDKEVAE